MFTLPTDSEVQYIISKFWCVFEFPENRRKYNTEVYQPHGRVPETLERGCLIVTISIPLSPSPAS
jgi:hypothetical protein